MGYGDDFWHGDFDECLREQLDGSGFTLEELREKSSSLVERTEEFTPEEPVCPNYEELFEDLPNGEGNQCYSEWIRQQSRTARRTARFPRCPCTTVRPRATTSTPRASRSTRWSSRTSTPTACATTAAT